MNYQNRGLCYLPKPKAGADLRIGSCLACVYRVMDARGKFGEHERSVRVARGDSFLSALQTSQVQFLIDHNEFSRCTVKENKGLYYRINTTQSVQQQLNENA